MHFKVLKKLEIPATWKPIKLSNQCLLRALLLAGRMSVFVPPELFGLALGDGLEYSFSV